MYTQQTTVPRFMRLTNRHIYCDMPKTLPTTPKSYAGEQEWGPVTCLKCGKEISRARLEAVPHARMCIACKEKEEQQKAGR